MFCRSTTYVVNITCVELGTNNFKFCCESVVGFWLGAQIHSQLAADNELLGVWRKLLGHRYQSQLEHIVLKYQEQKRYRLLDFIFRVSFHCSAHDRFGNLACFNLLMEFSGYVAHGDGRE